MPPVIFVFPNFYTGNLDYHLGANYIVAFLRANGINAEQFVIKRRIGLKELAESILRRNPRIIGFTCFDTNHHLIKILSREIKIKRPDVLMIAGGPTATFSDKELLRDIPEIDACVRGEGEYSALELIECFKNDKGLEGVKGVTYRKKERIIRNQDRPFVVKLDTMPSPYLAGILKPEDVLNQNGQITILTSRGCVYKCAYCNFSTMSKHTIRYHSIDRVIAELKVIDRLVRKNRNLKVIIMDDVFTLDRKRARELCKRITKEGIKLKLSADTRGDCVDKGLLKTLFKAGVIELNFGLESAVPRVLYAMKKARIVYNEKERFVPEKKYIQCIKDNVSFAKETGIDITVSTIFGIPGETYKDGLKTLDFVEKLEVGRYYHNFLRLYPGTELHRSFFRKQGPIYSASQSYPFFISRHYSEYDLGKLPYLDNKIYVDPRAHLVPFFLHNALMGRCRKEESDYPEYVIIEGNRFSFEWFKENAAFQTRIVFGKNVHNFTNFNKRGSVEITAKPFAAMLHLVQANGNSHSIRLNKRMIYPNKTFVFMKSGTSCKMASRKQKNATMIFDVSVSRDADSALRDLLKFSRNCIALDVCRWSSDCPALGMKRFIIDDAGGIRPCFQGKVVGNKDVPITKIKRGIRSLSKKTESDRGCNSCHAKDRCSKCMFLSSIPVDKYCNIMKNRQDLTKFIDSLGVFRAAEHIIGIKDR